MREEDTTTEAPEADPTVTFEDLGVRADIQEALAAVGITHPFPIQVLAIPIAIEGTDMIGQARTGTGKTLAFGITLIQRVILTNDDNADEVIEHGKPQALVLCPTRELALQVSKDLEIASRVRKARVLTVYGGVGYEPQLEALKAGVDIVVGTPGRVLDLANRGSLDLRYLRMLVLDEADEMLDLGFLPDVERLISMAPASRQMLLFSATMPSAIVSLARTHLSQPVNVRAEGHDAQATVPDTTQFIYQAHNLDKPEILGRLLQATEVGKVMVFTRTKRSAQRVSDDMADRGFESTSIHGDLNQAAREKALRRFRSGAVQVLVATDVAARGIDVTGVSHVVNYECPDDEKAYVHRIGRTGRAGAKGIAVTLVDWADSTRWKVINKALDLHFDNPPETYSNSEHLFEELSIPAGTKGRLASAKPPTDSGESRSDKSHPRSESGRTRSEGDRPRRKRKRSRTRNGHPVGDQASASEQPQTHHDAPNDSAAPADPDSNSADGKPARARRRRRSPRGGSGGDQSE